MSVALTLTEALNDALPQTQCTRCGYPDCRAYAKAMAAGEAAINQCPPGGQEGVARLAVLTGRPALPLNPANGSETPRQLAVIIEDWCIGCTLCLKACPVDCIVGGPKAMHTVIDALCTGCELCLPACPVDCIVLRPVTDTRTGWQAWSAPLAQQARERFEARQQRAQRDALEQAPLPAAASTATSTADKRSVIAAALARARAKRGS